MKHFFFWFFALISLASYLFSSYVVFNLKSWYELGSAVCFLVAGAVASYAADDVRRFLNREEEANRGRRDTFN